MDLKSIYKISFALLLLFFIVSCSLIKPIIVTKQYSLDDIISAIKAENYSLAYTEIKHVNVSNIPPESLTKYKFLQAFLSYKLGYYTQAQKYFAQLSSAKTGMEDYINWYLANSYIQTNNYNKAIGVLQTLASTYALSVFYKPAILLMGECMVKDRLYDSAIKLYSFYITNPAFLDQLPKMLTERAALYISENNTDKGIKDYLRVYTSFTNSPYADISLNALNSITTVSTLNIDHSEIAELLIMDGKYSSALPELELAINTYQQTDNLQELSILYLNLGIAYYHIGKYKDAIKALKQAIRYNNNNKNNHEAGILFWLGKTFIKDGDIENAKKTLLKITRFTSPYTPMAMYKLFQIYQQNNNPKSAEHWLKQLANLDTPFSLLAYWELGWYYYKQSKFDNAIYYFDKLEHSKYSDEQHKVKAMYWKAKALLKTGDIQRSQDIFFRVIHDHPLTYYSIMSNMWFGNNTLTFKANDIPLPTDISIKDNSAFYYHYSRYLFLDSIGLKKAAIKELDAASELNLSKEESLLLCHEYYKNNYYFNSLYIARTRFTDKLQALNNDTIPVWFYSYPLGYSNVINGYKERYRIDPLVLYALILQESRFRSDAISNAGALGIMQIMPTTAKKVAKDINLEPFYSTLLFEPDINIGIGTWYFNNLLTKYKGNYVLSLAAYNAGEKAVNSWLKSSTDCNTDEFIEDIPFEETRHYVKDIISNLVAYAMIYGGTINMEEHIYLEGTFLKKCPLSN